MNIQVGGQSCSAFIHSKRLTFTTPLSSESALVPLAKACTEYSSGKGRSQVRLSVLLALEASCALPLHSHHHSALLLALLLSPSYPLYQRVHRVVWDSLCNGEGFWWHELRLCSFLGPMQQERLELVKGLKT